MRERFIAASFYCEPEQIAAATQYGNTAVESLIQILEYFPDKLKANTLTPEQSRFVLAALRDASENIDRFMALMPAEVVERARAQVAEENQQNLEEMPKDQELLNAPTTVGSVAEVASGAPPPPPAEAPQPEAGAEPPGRPRRRRRPASAR